MERLIDSEDFAKHLERMARRAYPDMRPGLFEAAEFAKDFPAVDAVVLPCEAGRTVYVLDGAEIVSMTINHYEFHRHTGLWAVLLDSVVATRKKTVVNVKAFTKTVFINKEEAEKALAKGEKTMAKKKRLIYADDAKKALMGWETDPTDEEIEYTIDGLKTVDAVIVEHTKIIDGECKKCGWFGDCVAAKDYNFCPGCGRKVRRAEDGK